MAQTGRPDRAAQRSRGGRPTGATAERGPDAVIAQAVLLAAERISPRVKKSGAQAEWPDERRQVRTELVDALVELGVSRSTIAWETERPSVDWDPVPGGYDLYVYADGRRPPFWLVAELKLDKVEQTMWDLFRLTDGFSVGPLAGGRYLIAAADETAWSRPATCCELFPEDVATEQVHLVADLFRNNDRVYKAQLKRDYPKQPSRVPTAVSSTTLVAGVRLSNYPHLELRVVSVEIVDPTPIELIDGLPPILR